MDQQLLAAKILFILNSVVYLPSRLLRIENNKNF